ncbi:MAG: hypothetical protein AAF770_01775 [Bacteroidota bacterium]
MKTLINLIKKREMLLYFTVIFTPIQASSILQLKKKIFAAEREIWIHGLRKKDKKAGYQSSLSKTHAVIASIIKSGRKSVKKDTKIHNHDVSGPLSSLQEKYLTLIRLLQTKEAFMILTGISIATPTSEKALSPPSSLTATEVGNKNQPSTELALSRMINISFASTRLLPRLHTFSTDHTSSDRIELPMQGNNPDPIEEKATSHKSAESSCINIQTTGTVLEKEGNNTTKETSDLEEQDSPTTILELNTATGDTTMGSRVESIQADQDMIDSNQATQKENQSHARLTAQDVAVEENEYFDDVDATSSKYATTPIKISETGNHATVSITTDTQQPKSDTQDHEDLDNTNITLPPDLELNILGDSKNLFRDDASLASLSLLNESEQYLAQPIEKKIIQLDHNTESKTIGIHAYIIGIVLGIIIDRMLITIVNKKKKLLAKKKEQTTKHVS